MENKEQTARKELENSNTKSKPLEKDYRISKETRESQNARSKPLGND